MKDSSKTPSVKKLSGLVLQRLRSGRGWTQEDVAHQLGKARSSVAGWESGRGGLNLENLVAVLDELGVSMESFGAHFDALRISGSAPAHQSAESVRPAEIPRAIVEGSPAQPVVVQAGTAVLLLLGEEGREVEVPRDHERLRPWVRSLFKRTENLFRPAEEPAEDEDSPATVHPAAKKAV